MIRVASNGKIDENRARPREGSVAISKTGDNPELAAIDGATNITVNGFFIDRDTEWKVNTQGVDNAENEDN